MSTVIEVKTVDDLLAALHVPDLDSLVQLVRLGRQAMSFGSNVLDYLDVEVDAYGYVVDVKLKTETQDNEGSQNG